MADRPSGPHAVRVCGLRASAVLREPEVQAEPEPQRLALAITKGASMKDWLLNKAIAAHMRDPGRFDHGPAKSSVWGWLYFGLLRWGIWI